MRHLILAILALLICAASVFAQRDICEWCPVLDTPRVLTSDIVIADSTQTGERIEISGRVLASDGRTPVAGAILYLYHTNAEGIYPRHGDEKRSSSGYWHGYLRGWLKTNERGEFRIRTIKPASYPNSTIAAHIHCVIKEPTSDTGYYVEDFLFAGDPYLPKTAKQSEKPPHVVALTKSPDGVMRGRRDIQLP